MKNSVGLVAYLVFVCSLIAGCNKKQVEVAKEENDEMTLSHQKGKCSCDNVSKINAYSYLFDSDAILGFDDLVRTAPVVVENRWENHIGSDYDSIVAYYPFVLTDSVMILSFCNELCDSNNFIHNASDDFVVNPRVCGTIERGTEKGVVLDTFLMDNRGIVEYNGELLQNDILSSLVLNHLPANRVGVWLK